MLTREQAEGIAEEARQQGWESDKRMVSYMQDGVECEYNDGRGRVQVHQHRTSMTWEFPNPRDHHDWSGRGRDDKATCAVCGIYRVTYESQGQIRTNEEDPCKGERIEIKSVPLGTYSVELIWPTWQHPKYWISETDEWRRLKAKVDELKEIISQLVQRGWKYDNTIIKSGKFGMQIRAVYPPGNTIGMGVGGMRTWRKICREADSILHMDLDARRLTS